MRGYRSDSVNGIKVLRAHREEGYPRTRDQRRVIHPPVLETGRVDVIDSHFPKRWERMGTPFPCTMSLSRGLDYTEAEKPDQSEMFYAVSRMNWWPRRPFSCFAKHKEEATPPEAKRRYEIKRASREVRDWTCRFAPVRERHACDANCTTRRFDAPARKI